MASGELVVLSEYMEMTTVERIAHVTSRMAMGEGLTTRQIAVEYGISRQWACRMLGSMSRVVPLHSERGVWRMEGGGVCLAE